MFGSMDRKTAIVSAMAGAAALTAGIMTFRYGASMRHPVIGALAGLIIVGPAAGAIAGNVVRAVVGPSEPASLPANTIANTGGPRL